MPFDEELASRIRSILKGDKGLSEKRMFGGIAFMVYGNMAIGVTNKGELMLRTGKENHEELLEMDFVKPMNFTGKPMKGFVFVEPEGFEEDSDLEEWMEYALSYARSLPKKNK